MWLTFLVTATYLLLVLGLRVLKSLSSYNYQKSWKRARKQGLNGTCSWIFEKSEWKDWLGQPSSAWLWCTGACESAFQVLENSHGSLTTRLKKWVLAKQ